MNNFCNKRKAHLSLHVFAAFDMTFSLQFTKF